MTEPKINETELKRRAYHSAGDRMPELPTENTVSAWQNLLDELLDMETSDIAHEEADSWDWVIYTWMAFELCYNVASDTLHEAERMAEDCGSFEQVDGLYELATQIAYWIVYNAVYHELDEIHSDMIELAERKIETLEELESENG